MIGMAFKVFSKRLFGVIYEKPARSIFVYLAVFLGLHSSGLRAQAATPILYLMASTFTAGIMWQALSSEGNAAYLQNMHMLPFQEHKFAFFYVSTLGAYTLFTKTAALLSDLMAVTG